MLVHALTTSNPGILANQVCYEVRGALDAPAFRRAWETVIARHAALRTCILWEGLEHPVQVVRNRVELPFRVIDLQEVPRSDRSRRLGELRREDAAMPFNLKKAPLMRCTLARLGDDEHFLILNIHHLVVDRWSHAIVMEDLSACYAAIVADRVPDLAAAPGFREYIAWIADQNVDAAKRHWRAELRGRREPTRVDSGHRRGTPDRRTTGRSLSSAASNAIREQAAVWRTTPASLLLAGIGLGLARRTDTVDVTFGLTVSGRPPGLSSVERVVGSFVNNVPFRVRVDAKRTMTDWVRAIQGARVATQEYEHASPAEIQEWAGLADGKPLFDLLVLLNLADSPEPAWPGLTLRPVTSTLDAGYPLILSVGLEAHCFVLDLVHDARFEAAEELLDALTASVEAVGAVESDARVGDLLPGLRSETTQAAGAREVERDREADAPSEPIEEMVGALQQIWREVLGLESVGLDDDFFERGGTSVQAVQLFIRIETLLGRTLPLSTLIRASTVRQLLVEVDRPIEQVGPLVEFRSSGTRPPLFVIPGIGGNVVNYDALAAGLGPDQPFFALQSRGLDGVGEPLTSIEEIAEDFIEQLPAEIGDEFHLLGLCFGAAVAFEMAARLEARGRPARSLALLDPAVLSAADGAASSPRARFFKVRLGLYWRAFREADWRGRGRLLIAKTRRATAMMRNGMLTDATRVEMQLFRVKEANRQAVEAYRPHEFSGQARLFLSRDRDHQTSEDPRLAWLRRIHPEPRVILVPGNNSGDALTNQNVAAFANRLEEWLEEASGDGA